MNSMGSTPSTQGHVFITGGGSGIGLGAASVFLAHGDSVTLCGRTESKLVEAASTLATAANAAGTEVYLSPCDVADEQVLALAIDSANERRPLTAVVVNAGRGSAGPLTSTDRDDFDAVMQTNVTGGFLTIKHAARVLAANGGGAICAVSSIAGTHTHRFMHAYVASKAALNMLVRNAADELGALGVRVNAVAPGIVETDLSEALQQNAQVDEDYRINMPLGRRGTTADIAQAIRFLCSEDASWITGAVLPVDGGHHLRRGPNIDPLLSPYIADLPSPSPPR